MVWYKNTEKKRMTFYKKFKRVFKNVFVFKPVYLYFNTVPIRATVHIGVIHNYYCLLLKE